MAYYETGHVQYMENGDQLNASPANHTLQDRRPYVTDGYSVVSVLKLGNTAE